MLTAVTCVPDCENVAFQPWVTCWPAVKCHVSVHELSGVPRLVIIIPAVNPPDHCDETVYVAEHPADAALDEATPPTATAHTAAPTATQAASRRNR